MSMFWGVWMVGILITIGFAACFGYLLYLCVRALRKYLDESDAAVSAAEKGTHKRVGIILAVTAVVLVGLSAIAQKSAASVSVIGGADGPTSVFVAGKAGLFAGVLGTIAAVLNLAVYILVIYLLVLVIRALRKYLKGV